MQKLFNIKSKLVEKTQLNYFTYELEYEVPEAFEFKAGQFFVLLVTPPFRRSYSAVKVENGLMTLLIDIKPMGPASKYFIDTKVGDETIIMGPYGLYSLKETKLNKVFIATSTGIAPLLPMIDEMRAKEFYKDVKIDFFYGARFLKNDIAFDYVKDFIGDNFRYFRCISSPEEQVEDLKNENPSAEFKQGRVTEVVPSMNYDYQNNEFYICGSPNMVEDMRNILKEKGADKIYFEKY